MSEKLFGIYQGIVVNNVDPMQSGRLLIQCPTVIEAFMWAKGCVPAIQASFPQVGDAVWIMFEAGDSDYPVWVGVLPGRAA